MNLTDGIEKFKSYIVSFLSLEEFKISKISIQTALLMADYVASIDHEKLFICVDPSTNPVISDGIVFQIWGRDNNKISIHVNENELLVISIYKDKDGATVYDDIYLEKIEEISKLLRIII